MIQTEVEKALNVDWEATALYGFAGLEQVAFDLRKPNTNIYVKLMRFMLGCTPLNPTLYIEEREPNTSIYESSSRHKFT